MVDLNRLVRRNIAGLKPYSTARDEYSGSIGVFLDANENSIGSATERNFNRYPDPHQRELKERLAEIKNVPPERILLGNGSDEVIDLVIRAFCDPRLDRLMIVPPTYGMYAVSAATNDVEVIAVPLTPGYQLDIPAILAQAGQVKLIFLCSPNNPSGNSLAVPDVRELLEKFKGIVVVDEAYADFAPGKSLLPELANYNNLVIMQTFSKAWGLANLRLGMAFADPQIIEWMSRIKYPYNVNGLTQEMAITALQRVAVKDRMVAALLTERERLIKLLPELPVVEKVYPSDANFLLVKFHDARRVFDYLISQQIIVRDRSQMVHCANCLRITVGTAAENDILIAKLKEFKS